MWYSELQSKYPGLPPSGWEVHNPKAKKQAEDIEVTLLEEADGKFVGWYTARPYVGTLHWDGHALDHAMTEF